MEVDCSLRLCGDNENESPLKKKKFRETPTSPWVPFMAKCWPLGPLFCPSSVLQIRGVKGISALIFWNSALKIKLKGKNTLCSLRFQCRYSIYVVISFILSKKKLINIHKLYKSWKFSYKGNMYLIQAIFL